MRYRLTQIDVVSRLAQHNSANLSRDRIPNSRKIVKVLSTMGPRWGRLCHRAATRQTRRDILPAGQCSPVFSCTGKVPTFRYVRIRARAHTQDTHVIYDRYWWPGHKALASILAKYASLFLALFCTIPSAYATTCHIFHLTGPKRFYCSPSTAMD